MAARNQFVNGERAAQTAFCKSSDTFSPAAKNGGDFRGTRYDFLLSPEMQRENLYPGIREQAEAYFGDAKNPIVWHRMRRHLLSSQVCCLNFLMPFSYEPEALAKLLLPVIGPGAEMQSFPANDVPCRPTFVAFEWTGHGSYLNEVRAGGKLTRGANCTSADAAVMFTQAGRREMLLIEWKYTEAYGAALTGGVEANRTRESRYQKITFEPDGPIYSDLGLSVQSFFYEPFYQFLRQQILAFQLQKAHELECDRVRVLHIAPNVNRAFRRVTAPLLRCFGEDAIAVWLCLLKDKTAFISMTTESLFGSFDAAPWPRLADWQRYVTRRYAGILNLSTTASAPLLP
jgi:hypothetical protein